MNRPVTPRARRLALVDTEVAEYTSATRPETLRDRMDRGTFTATGWIAPEALSDEGWLRTGETILALERATPWCWGDWYAARSSLTAERLLGADWNGPSIHTLQNYASVAKAFPHSRRRECVSFKHHAELVRLSATEQHALLNWCAATPVSVMALRRELQRRAATALPAPDPLPPKIPTSPEATKTPPPPRLPVEPRPEGDLDILVKLFVPAGLYAWAVEVAVREEVPLVDWIIGLIDEKREHLRDGK